MGCEYHYSLGVLPLISNILYDYSLCGDLTDNCISYSIYFYFAVVGENMKDGKNNSLQIL